MAGLGIPLGISKQEPASEFQILECERHFHIHLPLDYVSFLKVTNGGEGAFGEAGYLAFYQVQDLAQFNDGYRVLEFMPGHLLFATDRGGDGYFFRMEGEQWLVIQAPFIGMPENAIVVAPSFRDFLAQG